MNYYVNETTEEFAGFSDLQTSPSAGWRTATDAEIQFHHLTKAKDSKILELKRKQTEFTDSGILYTGAIVVSAWDSETTYPRNVLVRATDSEIYRSLQADNLDHEPIESSDWWNLFFPVFRLDAATVMNIDANSHMSVDNPNRYKFYSKSDPDGFRVEIDFGDATNWDAFVEIFTDERDRVMKKYNAYRSQIALCATVAEVDAIVIDFSE